MHADKVLVCLMRRGKYLEKGIQFSTKCIAHK